MRVLIIAGSYPPEPCGVGDYIGQLARALASETDIDVAVLTRGQPTSNDAQRLAILRPVQSWKVWELSSILKRARNWRPDIVHIQYPTRGFFAKRLPLLLPLSLRLAGLRVVVTWHEPPPCGVTQLLFLLTSIGVSGLIFVRPHYLDYFNPKLQFWLKRLPLSTIPNAANLPVSCLSAAERETLRQTLLQGQSRLLVFFGFVARHKGVERLFDIANPVTDHLVISGGSNDDAYYSELKSLASSSQWRGKVTFTGFAPPTEAADLLAAADAVVLPFLSGGGSWNTSLHSALAQGSFVITTGEAAHGDDPTRNLYVAPCDGLAEMRDALCRHAGRRVAPSKALPWKTIAKAHLEHYAICLGTPD